jgi:hypothetical protein
MKQKEIDDECDNDFECENQSYNVDSRSADYDYYNLEENEEQNRSATYESYNLLETNENGRYF